MGFRDHSNVPLSFHLLSLSRISTKRFILYRVQSFTFNFFLPFLSIKTGLPSLPLPFFHLRWLFFLNTTTSHHSHTSPALVLLESECRSAGLCEALWGRDCTCTSLSENPLGQLYNGKKSQINSFNSSVYIYISLEIVWPQKNGNHDQSEINCTALVGESLAEASYLVVPPAACRWVDGEKTATISQSRGKGRLPSNLNTASWVWETLRRRSSMPSFPRNEFHDQTVTSLTIKARKKRTKTTTC